MKGKLQITIAGFVSEETDFTELLRRRPEVASAEPLGRFIDALVELRGAAVGGGSSGLLTIIGHADRDLTPNRSEDDRRATEAARGLARANSADAFIEAAVLAREGVMGLERSTAYPGDHFYINTNTLGAMSLAAPPGSEENALKNRRVELRLVTTNVGAIGEGDESFSFE